MRVRGACFFFVSLTACSSSHHAGLPVDGGADDDGGGTDDGGPVDGGSEGFIGPEGGTVSDDEGASVEVPPGAVSEPTAIGVESVDSGFPDLPTDVAPRGVVHAFTPHGQTFDVAVTVIVPFDGAPSADLRLVTSSPDGEWTTVAEATVDGATMTADVDHFSFFVVVEPIGPQTICVGTGCPDAFDAGGGAGVVVDGDGALGLDPESAAPRVIWIANTHQSTISKVDTTTRVELARYRTGTNEGEGQGLVQYPSRTSVDFRGDAFVVNTGVGNPVVDYPRIAPSLTRIRASDCDDRGDGVVDTSSAGDDILPWPTEADWDDDCIAWNTELVDANLSQGDRGAIATQLVIGLDGALEEVVWVGLQYAKAFYVLDAEDGADTGREVDVSPTEPYGATLDRDGFLWAWSALWDGPVRIDTATDAIDCAGQSCDPPSEFCMGIAVDEMGDIWCGGHAHVYRSATDEWEAVPIPESNNESLSNVASDGNGHVYYPSYDGIGAEAPRFYRIDREDPSAVETLDAGLSAGNCFIGISIDLDGFVWGLPAYAANAAVLDPSDDSVEIVLNDCPGGYPDATTTGCLYGAFTSSDMTAFDVVGAATPTGEYRQAFECADAAPGWTSLAWDADVPEKTSLTIDVRTAADAAGLELAPWTRIAQDPGDASPIDLVAAGVAAEAVLEVRFELTSVAHDATPLLRSFTIETTCE